MKGISLDMFGHPWSYDDAASIGQLALDCRETAFCPGTVKEG